MADKVADLPASCKPWGPGAQGLALAAGLLVTRYLRHDSADPYWHDRDRVFMAATLPGLAESLAPQLGVETLPVLPLAIGAATGAALAERRLAGRFGRSLVDHRAWVFCDGESLITGPVQEAAWLAGAWRLGRLCVLAALPDPGMPGLASFAAHGWTLRLADTGDPGLVGAALSAALRSFKPTLIACIDPGPADLAARRAAGERRAAGVSGAGARRAWLKRLARHAGREDFEHAMSGRLTARWHAPLSEPATVAPPGTEMISTADSLRRTLPGLQAALPELALLPGSAFWPALASQTEPPPAAARPAAALAGGIGAVMGGMALHGGVLPICAQEAAALPDLLPALQMAAAQRVQLILFAIEPARDPATMRTVENLAVFRPADAMEALECLELAIRRQTGPSVVLLSPVPVATLAGRPSRTRSRSGGFLAVDPPGPLHATLIASGPELHLALAAQGLLMEAGKRVAVASLPCWQLFAQADPVWQASILGRAPRIGIEPGSGFGWREWLGQDGLFVPAEGTTTARGLAQTIARHLSRPTA